MSEITDNIQKALHSQKNQETEITSENENVQEAADTEQAKDETASTGGKGKIEKIKEMRLQKGQPEEPNEPETEDFDLSGFESLNNTVAAKTGTQQGGGISVVNSSGKGKCKRIELSTAIMDYLGLKDSKSTDDTIQFLINGDKIVIGQKLTATGTDYYIRRGQKGEKRGAVYHSALVSDLTEKFGLDFSNGHSCRSFSNIKYSKSNDKKIVIITVN